VASNEEAFASFPIVFWFVLLMSFSHAYMSVNLPNEYSINEIRRKPIKAKII